MSALRHGEIGTYASRRLPVLLQVYWLRRDASPEEGRLLRVLLVWLGAVSADPG
jgi:hypothetical protein